MPKCKLIYIDIQKDGEAFYTRDVHLPFTPFVGLEIHFDDHQSSFHVDDPIKWDVSRCCFVLRETNRITNLQKCPCTPDDECCVICHWVFTNEGWKLDHERRGENRLFEFEGMFEPEKTYTALRRRESELEESIDVALSSI